MVDIVGFLSFLGGVVAGAGGSFGGKYLWKQYTKPELEFDAEVEAVSVQESTDDGIKTVASRFQVFVTNTGKVAAQNARPRLRLSSIELPSPVEPYWEPPDPEDLPEDAIMENVIEPSLEGLDFNIDTPLVWSEGERQSRLTINPGETVSFDLLMIDQKNRDKKQRDQLIEFPSERGWNDPAKMRTQQEGYRNLPKESTVITKYQLINGDWEHSYVEVTSENAEKIRGNLWFFDDKGWTQIRVE